MGNYPQYNYGSQLQNMGTFPQLQQMFPQPQGSVYSINAPLDVGNVPIGSTGLSVALCLAENLMYIKSFQNGNPVIMAYRIAPFTKDTTEKGGQTQTAAARQKTSKESTPVLEEIIQRLDKIEQGMNQAKDNGGVFNGLL